MTPPLVISHSPFPHNHRLSSKQRSYSLSVCGILRRRGEARLLSVPAVRSHSESPPSACCAPRVCRALGVPQRSAPGAAPPRARAGRARRSAMEDPRVSACLACLTAAQDAAALEPRRLAAQMQEEVSPSRALRAACPTQELALTQPPALVATQLKAGEPRTSAGVAASLAAPGRPLEARVFGLSVLHHLIKSRWAVFAAEDRAALARLALDRLRDCASPRRACARGARPRDAPARDARRGRKCPRAVPAAPSRRALTPRAARSGRRRGRALGDQG